VARGSAGVALFFLAAAAAAAIRCAVDVTKSSQVESDSSQVESAMLRGLAAVVLAAAALPALTVALEALAQPRANAALSGFGRSAPLVIAAALTPHRNDFDLCLEIPVPRKPSLGPAARTALANGLAACSSLALFAVCAALFAALRCRREPKRPLVDSRPRNSSAYESFPTLADA